jgi:hypothetical protein
MALIYGFSRFKYLRGGVRGGVREAHGGVRSALPVCFVLACIKKYLKMSPVPLSQYERIILCSFNYCDNAWRSAWWSENTWCWSENTWWSESALRSAWWKSALRSIAVKLFSMATSSAASERNFSAMGFIHSKLQNTLSPSSVEKLVYIKTNLNTFPMT